MLEHWISHLCLDLKSQYRAVLNRTLITRSAKSLLILAYWYDNILSISFFCLVGITSCRQTGRQTDAHTHTYRHTQKCRQIDRQTETGRQTDTYRYRQTDRGTDRQTDRHSDRHGDKQTDRQSQGAILVICRYVAVLQRSRVLYPDYRINPITLCAGLVGFGQRFRRFKLVRRGA